MNLLKTALYIVGAIIVAGIFFGGRFNLAPTTPTPTPAPIRAQSVPAAPPSPSSTPAEGTHQDDAPSSPTPSHSGGEDPQWEIPSNTRQGSITVTQQFIDGWLNPDPEARRKFLAPVAAQALIEELTVANLRTWATTPTGTPLLVEITSTDAMTRQAFADGRRVDLLLAAEPGTPNGWIVTDIQPSIE